MAFDLGDTYGATITVTDAAGAPTDATTVTLTITLPDQTTITPSVANPPTDTGVYTHDYVTVQAGRHVVAWTTTGPATAFVDVFDVRSASPGYIVSLADTKSQLNMTSTSNDEELRMFIEAATEIIEERRLEAIPIRSFVEVHDGGRILKLRRPPIRSVTTLAAVLDDGESYLPVDLDVDTTIGIVRRKDGGFFCGPLRVTYTAGYDRIPARYVQAAKVIVGHLWRTQRGPGTGSARFAGSEPESEFLTGMGFSIPHRAVELLGARTPAVA